MRKNGDDSYDIRYDDGDEEKGVAAEFVKAAEDADKGSKTQRRQVAAPAPAPAAASDEEDKATSGGFEAGTKILARYKGKKRWYGGTVMKRNEDGSYDIMYDDGDKESGVAAEFVKAAEVIASDEAAPAPAPAAEGPTFEAGAKIEALYKGKKHWYTGAVDKVNADGTYDVIYDDGDTEKGVKPEHIRAGAGDSELEVGQRIEAKYRGKKKYYPGKIAARAGDNGTYDIAYDDGEEESGVARNLIREA